MLFDVVFGLRQVATYWVQLDPPTIGTTNDGDREITSATATQEALTFTSGHGAGPPRGGCAPRTVSHSKPSLHWGLCAGAWGA